MKATTYSQPKSPTRHGRDELKREDPYQVAGPSTESTGEQRRRLVAEAMLLVEELHRRVQRKRRPHVPDAA